MSKKPNLVTSNTCPGCNKAFTSLHAVRGHLRFCPARQEVVGKQPDAPSFVAAVKPAPVPQPELEAAPVVAAAPVAAPTFVAHVDVPPPPPAPPQAAEETQYVPRMPLPNNAAGTGGVPLEQWHATAAFPNQLEPLHAEPPPAQAQLAGAAGTVSVATVGQPPPPGAQLATVDGPKPAVDVVKVMQVLSKRTFDWEGGGPLTDEECELLRTVITWQPGPASGAALIIAGVFGPRLLTHPKVADAMGRLFDAGVDRVISELTGDQAAPAAAPAREPARAAAAPASAANVNSPAAPQPAPHAQESLADAWAAVGVDMDEVAAMRRKQEAA